MALKAIQQFQLRTVLGSEPQARETLRLVKQSGYEGIELCGFMNRKMPLAVRMLTRMAGMPVGGCAHLDWKELIRESGLLAVSIHEDLGTILNRPELVIQEAKGFQTEFVVVTGIYRFDFSDETAVRALANDLNQAGRIMAESGIQLLYHNHNAELRKVPSGKTAYELLLEETNPDYVNFEFDSYWPVSAGADALSMMQSLGERMKLYHINDFGTRQEGAAMTPIVKADSMELGTGNIKLLPLLEQAKSVGVKAVILETHRNWMEKSPVKSFQKSAEFMKKYV